MKTPEQMYMLYVAITFLSISLVYFTFVLHRRITRQNTHYVYHLDTRLSATHMDAESIDNRIDTMIERKGFDLKRFNPTPLLTENCVTKSLPIIHHRMFKGSKLVAVILEEVPIYAASTGCLAQHVAVVPMYHHQQALAVVLEPKTTIPYSANEIVIRGKHDYLVFGWILNGIASCQSFQTAQQHTAFLREVFLAVYALRKHYRSMHRLIYVPGKAAPHILMEISVWDARELERALNPLYASRHVSFVIDRDRSQTTGPSVRITFTENVTKQRVAS